MTTFDEPKTILLLREWNFLLFEQFKLGEILSKSPFSDWGEEEVKSALSECYKWAKEISGPINANGDMEGCRLEDGKVYTPKGFKEAYKHFVAGGWMALNADPNYGGQGLPKTLQICLDEMLASANVSFSLYTVLTQGAVHAIQKYASDA